MTKPRSSRLKPLFYLILFLSIVVVVVYAFLDNGALKHTENEKPITLAPANKKPSNHDALVSETFSLSKEGKIKDCSFISGQTNRQEVNHTWGKPSQTTKTVNSKYEEYLNHDAVVGYQGELMNDLRSYDQDLQNIHFNEIKKVGGEPNEVRYFKDNTNDQIILIYHVNSSYDLKWILPKPSNQESNPKVDHISVYALIKNQPSQSQSDHQKNISEMIADMSLDEKIGQMIIAGISGTTVDTNAQKLIAQSKVGGFIFYANNLVNPQQTVQLLNQMKSENVPNPLPLLLSIDQEGGKISRLPGGFINFPTNKEIGSINNSQFSYKVGTLLGSELKGFGFNLDYAPVLDVNSNPKNPIIGDRSFGNNPEIVSKLGIQTMKGIQSQNIIPTIKHFPGHGDTSVDSHLELPIVYKSLAELKKLELIPFERSINSGADVVMVAHILLPKLDAKFPASMSKNIITDILRKQLHFNGVVITDDMTMKAITNHYNIGSAAVDSVKAGSDLILVAHDYNKIKQTISSLKTAVQKGEISEQRINGSVSRIIKLKRKYQINNTKAGNTNIGKMNQSIKNLLDAYTK
ncbi:beta-N-acetylhexosaminidase [Neobacillus sp. PS3-40]|uniref:beta-N-acetylhexosaminidase n=1 Tax=Neobacillus sp. PS3-40 TaxID=3070679 RepID=UPI0027DF2341|nr:beta-N-acetylhexosaminidase [Neobacillus sp. PS3-40]WML42855.1 beta-N-acetylhexosaminidase [Neobacillus sp. PS3-40]